MIVGFLVRTLHPFLGHRVEEWSDRFSNSETGHIAIKHLGGASYDLRGPVNDGDVFYDMQSFYPQTYEPAWEWDR